MTLAALLLAAVVLLSGNGSRCRLRKFEHRRTVDVNVLTGDDAARAVDPLAAAATFDVLATCLRAGMALPTAAAASATSAPPHLARILRRAADLLSLGADPSTAWGSPDRGPADRHAEALLRLARRSASSGTALAQGLNDLADQSRSDAADVAHAAAERGSVLIAGPLGLCYLPAFVCLGIVPVVVGLAHDVLESGIL